ncbi:hypothetical protein ASD00_26815 [Ensifer sp. Root31]|nr:hypothetical protein ASD00_26815 [Ensifer sp. Root31]
MTVLLLPDAVSARIRSYLSTRSDKNEHGGLLLGYRKPGAIEIKDVTFPSRWDRSSPVRFHRSAMGHRIKALREWISSGGTVDWVGEWHSHPIGSCQPSSIDRNNWRMLAVHTGRPMAFLIFGRGDLYAGMQLPWNDAYRSLSVAERSNEAELYR